MGLGQAAQRNNGLGASPARGGMPFSRPGKELQSRWLRKSAGSAIDRRPDSGSQTHHGLSYTTVYRDSFADMWSPSLILIGLTPRTVLSACAVTTHQNYRH
jgi:hypothetical protein